MTIRWRSIAGLAVATAACGGGAGSTTPDAAASGSGSGNQPAVTYEGKLDRVPPVPFGGMPFCTYTESLDHVVLDLLIKPSGAVIGGALQSHNVEATTNGCTLMPAPPSNASYTLTGAQAGSDGTQLTFTGAATNSPVASLTIQLTQAGQGYNAAFTIHRTDQPSAPVLEWTVTGTVQLMAKP